MGRPKSSLRDRYSTVREVRTGEGQNAWDENTIYDHLPLPAIVVYPFPKQPRARPFELTWMCAGATPIEIQPFTIRLNHPNPADASEQGNKTQVVARGMYVGASTVRERFVNARGRCPGRMLRALRSFVEGRWKVCIDSAQGSRKICRASVQLHGESAKEPQRAHDGRTFIQYIGKARSMSWPQSARS